MTATWRSGVAEFPALPFFTDAYLADTRHLTAEEHGVYLLLLMCAWRTRGCALRDEDRTLARIAGVSAGKWRKLRPTMLEFFTVVDGYWYQKKLSQVYETVARKVERNRLNGAKGGRAKSAKGKLQTAQRNYLKEKESSKPNANISLGWSHIVGSAENAVTKTKSKTNSGSEYISADGELGEIKLCAEQTAEIAAAAALDVGQVDYSIVTFWITSGADLQIDVVPTIERLRKREQARVGQAPYYLTYYSAAILEARDKRVSAKYGGLACAVNQSPKAVLQKFNAGDADDWRRFLGDATSRFRGDYLSSHWRIPSDHPVFEAADLGPDPRHRANQKIPAEIYDEYGALWNWRPQA